ncbi:hypothetical protein FSP39_006236 [Pinctada imbricata]|uniref:MD-2-related lipid-recognition domain-containing protein n=1 Tax=Pinctada imbricata TaxID=66713 RepID=A0AA88YHM7_PINIB|nr:hypothetical protein FSP39_006236 [Pinctada imbricata]
MFSHKDHSPNKVIHVTSAHISPYPVIVPGDITGDIVIQAPRYVNGKYKIQLAIHKKALLWIKVPCLSGVGSCDYELCDLLSRNFIHDNVTTCPQQLVDQNLPCTCPFQPGTYTLKPTTFTVPKLDSLWSWLASGDYHVDAKLIEESTGEEVANYHVELSVHQPPCKGFLCSIFG